MFSLYNYVFQRPKKKPLAEYFQDEQVRISFSSLDCFHTVFCIITYAFTVMTSFGFMYVFGSLLFPVLLANHSIVDTKSLPEYQIGFV